MLVSFFFSFPFLCSYTYCTSHQFKNKSLTCLTNKSNFPQQLPLQNAHNYPRFFFISHSFSNSQLECPKSPSFLAFFIFIHASTQFIYSCYSRNCLPCCIGIHAKALRASHVHIDERAFVLLCAAWMYLLNVFFHSFIKKKKYTARKLRKNASAAFLCQAHFLQWDLSVHS